ncbi:MAG: glycerol-3-phosphate 1-O-acyltransferase PlsY [Candidatus Latescibacteria bacterium]|nr:glycerol-3-phosphate 1-O-acyltransferase PlsY [Candidatus Latescibacterota bacterium]NIM21319.1 glycerol-3-phosphate 1-O-acyltransferase PlsY [Candidatus Latescibacterota bacterium]NIM65500.1 glycerol-3-phosphate 1-O-acyltransferase PlsY [Candidatus Latescibacterota bacterium]NIO01880.1 glycerol-3-phosphate 1-O-acyltransferase PlsY [Candidatus Latescibacterota bacterium]NIO28693.1 glycerol-3-phosphate 1-O-acyltransferase PlsY [Candidatus Latescibacterota bacterium]
MISLFVVILVSYLIGSIPFSYIAGKLKAGIDLREHGSGNLGASNTFRILGPRVASLVLLGDVVKGFLPVYFAPHLGAAQGLPSHWLMLAAALFTVLGHMFSIYLKFTGGKGIATSAGAFLALTPWACIGAVVVWGIVMAIKRIVSLASLSAAVALPFIVYASGRLDVSSSHWSLLVLSIIVSIVVIIRHKSNIERLLKRSEPNLARKKQ